MRFSPPIPAAVPFLATLLALAACSHADATGAGPTIYVALDQQFSEPVLNEFAAELGFPIRQQHDAENNKTVGLVTRILEDRDHQRCTVFWNNEVAHTVNLASKGVLVSYESPNAKDVPAQWRDPEHRWTAFAARARILVVNTELLPDRSEWPSSYKDLTDPKWRGRCAIAVPKTGTTLTHFTAMWKLLGDDGMEQWIRAMKDNDVAFLASNGATLRAVRDGNKAFAFTDTDDFHVARLHGFPVEAVFPDQRQGEIGTMLIPNSVALIAGGPDQEHGKRLIDRILARDTEALLAAAESAQIPLRDGIPGPRDPSIKKVSEFRQMDWDIHWTGEHIGEFQRRFLKQFGL
ncbi:MAG TPA: extracellular solute-binding protein [bacterium]|nr:extracellular solute-binding protein [bacterium]